MQHSEAPARSLLRKLHDAMATQSAARDVVESRDNGRGLTVGGCRGCCKAEGSHTPEGGRWGQGVHRRRHMGCGRQQQYVMITSAATAAGSGTAQGIDGRSDIQT